MKNNAFSFTGMVSIVMIIIEVIFLFICATGLLSYYSGGTIDFTVNGQPLDAETAVKIYSFCCVFLAIAIVVLFFLAFFFFRSSRKSFEEVHQQKVKYIVAIILSFIFGISFVGVAALMAFLSRNVNVSYGTAHHDEPIEMRGPRDGNHGGPPERSHSSFQHKPDDSEKNSSESHRRR